MLPGLSSRASWHQRQVAALLSAYKGTKKSEK